MRPFHPPLWVDRLFLNKMPERAQKTLSRGKEMKRHTPQLRSQRIGAQTDEITHMHLMQPHFCSLCFALWHTRMSQPDKEDSQSASLSFSSPTFSQLPFTHISRFIFPPTFTLTQKHFPSTLSSHIIWESTQFEILVHQRQARTSSKMHFCACIDCDQNSFTAALFCCYSTFWLRDVLSVCIHSITLAYAYVTSVHHHQLCWAYRCVLAHLNAFASHANVTKSGAVALVAMQPLN